MKKRYKKILLYGSMFLMMNILFVACTGEVKETVLSDLTPTATVTVTQTPVSTQPVITIQPTKELELTPSPTEELKQHITPRPSVTITPTEVSTVTPTMTPTPVQTVTLIPTLRPTATPTLQPTATPTLQPTATPTLRPTVTPTLRSTVTPTLRSTVTPTLQPSATLTLIPFPTMIITPIPVKDPLTLVYAGWQQVTDPSGHYAIVFPDMYDKVSLKKESDFFKYVYTASSIPDIQWELCFNMDDTVELRQKKIIEQYPEMRIKLQADGFAYYAETDTIFVAGEVYAWNYETTGSQGVMHIETSYPSEKKEEYQKQEYYWYVCVLKEE